MREGRFTAKLADIAGRFSESVSFDRRLYKQDIAGSLAHAAALRAAGVVTAEEETQITSGLRVIEQEIDAGKFEWNTSREDVHMNIEAALTERIGPAGAKLHTARSRNDQIALDLRLWVKTGIDDVRAGLRDVQRALIELAAGNADVVMPAYTHLQRAQPILFGHYLLAVVEALARDDERLRDCGARTDVMPLGSGAVAGSTIVLDRELVARQLGFSRISQNSLDAVSDRDFICEFLFCLAMIGLHLSRLSEDLILWSTTEFGFVAFSDAFATGSSLMPQKKNPDVAELTRGKTGRLYGNLMAILTVLKGLPSAYNRDLQEDKEALFDSFDTICSVLAVFGESLPQLQINASRMEQAASDPSLLATDLAEYLVQRGLPFREAHLAIGRLVTQAAAAGTPLDDVPLESLRNISPLFGDDVGELFDPRASLRRRKAVGAPSPENVQAQIARWRELLAC